MKRRLSHVQVIFIGYLTILALCATVTVIFDVL